MLYIGGSQHGKDQPQHEEFPHGEIYQRKRIGGFTPRGDFRHIHVMVIRGTGAVRASRMLKEVLASYYFEQYGEEWGNGD